MNKLRISEVVKLVAVGLASTLYIAFVVFVYRIYRNQRKMNEAFFKFERHDLVMKINKIEGIAKQLEDMSN